MSVPDKVTFKISFAALKDLSVLLEYNLDTFQLRIAFDFLNKFRTYTVSGRRRLGKTLVGSFCSVILALGGFRGLYTAQEGPTVDEIRDDVLARWGLFARMNLVLPITEKNPRRLQFLSGGSILFRTRLNQGVARGTKLDFIIWDEAQMVSNRMYFTSAPALSTTNSLGKQLFLGTPPTAREWNLVGNGPFVRARQESVNNGAKNYVEFSAVSEYSADIKVTRALIKKNNPSAKRISDFKELLNMAKVDHKNFCIEYLGIWYFPESYVHVEYLLNQKDLTSVMTKRAMDASYVFASVGLQDNSDEAYLVVTDGKVIEAAEKFNTIYGSVDEIAELLVKNSRMLKKVFVPYCNKGRALFSKLKQARVEHNVEMLNDNAQATKLSMFMSGLDKKKFAIYETSPHVKSCLSTLTLELDAKSGVSRAKSASPGDTALALAHINAVMNDKDKLYLERYNVFGNLAKENV